SDLRECVTGDTLVLLADGSRRPIQELCGQTPEVLAMGEDGRIVRAASDRVWKVGERDVLELKLASGRTLRATAEHRIFTARGWQKLGDVSVGEGVALARRLPEAAEPERCSSAKIVLLAHLLASGRYVAHQPLAWLPA